MTGIAHDLEAVKVSCKNCSLSELCLPRALQDSDIATLDAILERPHSLAKGEVLFHEGDASKALYAVRSGSFKTYAESAHGDQQIFGFHLAGELMGLDSMEKDIHTCTAVALEDTSVCRLPMSDLNDLCLQIPDLQKHMTSLIGREISNDHSLLLLLGKARAEERMATFLLSLSTRFEQRGYSHVAFNLSMSRHDIGSYLGLAVETVSRILTQFQAQGLIKVERRAVELTNIDGLRALVGTCPGKH